MASVSLAYLLLASSCQDSPSSLQDLDSDVLVERLKEISEEGIGFSPGAAGVGFFPLHQIQIQTSLLGNPEPKLSPILVALASKGARAIPTLVNHLNDETRTRLIIKPERGVRVRFTSYYDVNRRVSPLSKEDPMEALIGTGPTVESYTATVGDLCYVALGQIVNRNFAAIRYLPSLIIRINSPTYSKVLHDALVKDWSGMTVERHRALLVQDAEQADSLHRLTGALVRLAYYYPVNADAFLIRQLKRPMYCGMKVDFFMRQTLLKESDANSRAEALDGFVSDSGAPYREGVLVRFQSEGLKLGSKESPDAWDASILEIARSLFPTLDPAKRVYAASIDIFEQAQVVQALADHHSADYDRTLVALLESLGDGKFSDSGESLLGLECMNALLGRGFDDVLRRQCRKILSQAPLEFYRTKLELMLEALKEKR